ncbi:helix-turn-helix domain-containing protein [Gordonia sp. L191]|uniref:AraC family transcriptional regulator n=1 Tax=Gordonia sp. L191 TaxID=2982699 RepID=UPI0024BF2985|nr:AraC family transcriptional regulator [Gordonia sp. L191]WHU46308.1 helix-turn-helix domain-containing protein [Gordonia sp. L191]
MTRTGLDPRLVARWRREVGLAGDDAGDAVRLRGRAGASTLGCARVVGDARTFDCVYVTRSLRHLTTFCALVAPGVCERDRRYRDHRHTVDSEPGVAVLVTGFSGSIIIRRGDEQTTYGPGQLVVHPTSEMAVIEVTGAVDPAGVVIPVDSLGEELGRRTVRVQTLLSRATAQFVRELALSSLTRAPSFDPDVELAAIDLVRAVLDNQRTDLSRVRDNSLVMWAAVDDLIARRHTDPTFGVADIARELNISRRHLYRHFTDSSKSLSDLISERRIARAQGLLVAPHRHTFAEIAAASGFGSAATLRSRFRTELGLTPAEYRR